MAGKMSDSFQSPEFTLCAQYRANIHVAGKTNDQVVFKQSNLFFKQLKI